MHDCQPPLEIETGVSISGGGSARECPDRFRVLLLHRITEGKLAPSLADFPFVFARLFPCNIQDLPVLCLGKVKRVGKDVVLRKPESDCEA